MLAGGHNPFCAHYWFVMDYTFTPLNVSIFRTILGYSGYFYTMVHYFIYISWLFLCCTQRCEVPRAMSFWARPILCKWICTTLLHAQLLCSFDLFCSRSVSAAEIISVATESGSSMGFLFSMYLSLWMLSPVIGHFIIWVLGYPVFQWVWLCIRKIHFSQQELQAYVLMLHRMSFHSTGMVVALHLGSSMA